MGAVGEVYYVNRQQLVFFFLPSLDRRTHFHAEIESYSSSHRALRREEIKASLARMPTKWFCVDVVYV